jgi:hypothetical protein
MTIIVEDGTGVTGANSYVTVDEFRDYAEARGTAAFSSTDADYDKYLILACDKLESYAKEFKGQRVATTQALQWPRYDVYLDDYLVANTTIPRELKYAQMAFALESLGGLDLMPNQLVATSAAVIKEKVGDLEVAYANPTNLRSTPAFAKAEALLSTLLKQSGLFGVRA